jgi:hypothetical protein
MDMDTAATKKKEPEGQEQKQEGQENPFLEYNNLSQACISDNIMSFLSLQRLWDESTNEYVTFLVLSLHPQVLATMS